ncbi:MAG: ROK family protein [Candidatus Omnitrophica bacterium]|nr:ROK family protein [Candidatus Omnitrophota bacterium]
MTYTIGIDVGGTKIYSILVDSSNNILAISKKKTKKGTPDFVLERTKGCLEDLFEKGGLQASDISGIGVGFPGPLDPDQGIVFEATNLPEWDHFPLAEKISEISNTPVFLDNDVNLGTLGEALAGAGHGAQNVIGIFLGTGVGGGIVLGGQLYRGTSGTAGEVGHMIIHHNGPKSPRNLRGTVEGLTSRTSVVSKIVKEIKKGGSSSLKSLVDKNSEIKSRPIAEAFRAGDKLVKGVLDETAEYVGVIVGSLGNLLAPDVVVLGGGLVEAVPEAILPKAREVAKTIVVPSAWELMKIEAAELGDNSGAMGGAILARQKAGAKG